MAHKYYAYARHMDGSQEIVTLKWVEVTQDPTYPCSDGGFSKPVSQLDANEQAHLDEFLTSGQTLEDVSNLPKNEDGMNTL